MKKEKLKEFTEILSLFLVGGMVYIPLQYISNFFSEKINDEKHLEKMLIKESFKLDLNDKKITARFGATIFGTGECRKLTDNHYEIVLDEGSRTKGILKHELYHIYRGDLKEKTSFLKYLFLHEPRAILYQTLGIKL